MTAASPAPAPVRKVVVVGGVAGGMSTATRLRRNDESLRIVVLERGAHVSFANCGLPYHVGGVIEDREALLLQTPQSLGARFAIDVRTRHEVTAIDTGRRMVRVRDLATGADLVEEYDALVLAPGAAPVVPPIPGIERALTLRDVADVDTMVAALAAGPRSAVILGAGFIGLELAENLHARGVAVTIVELAEQVLAPLDVEMAAPVRAHLAAAGIDVRTGTSAAEVTDATVLLTDGTELAADLVVAAIGVRPESGLAVLAGLEVGPRGGIVVDEQQRTSDPHVYAVGDAAEKRDAIGGEATLVPLAQTANRHGRLVADVITGRAVRSAPVLGTAVVGVLGLTVAAVGWSEKRLRAAGRPVRAIHTHPTSHAGYYPGAEQMALKVLVDPVTDLILGAQGVGGAGVDKRIDVIATAMRAGLHASDLADLELAYAPQYGSAKDPVNMVGFIADNLASGRDRAVQWHELDAELARGAVLVDVRSPAEHAAGAIPGAVNIPVDELRDRLAEVPPGPVVVHCAVGLRGHVAARLLAQHGRDVANLDGGHRTWVAGTVDA
ncbi:FAD-dependent oxidoreductase [Nocardioides sp. AE5]|uniref:FAD-dependent oxidoreductase n=1 Tax=Nocardioides sp. AE5 TaxID=2962573 RepID=UPI002881CC79|nr:FAD-dependent oxidoreductase [Nocardioides sp. AE5]MDT0202275.1 FAD-dependent oxidoreductase [Nocardioides sp. AE5]